MGGTRYLSEVPEANVFNQAKSNKEVRVTVTDQRSLSNVKTRLNDMTSDMTSLIRDDMMQGDEPTEDYNQMFYSSGDRKNTFVITDDEDFGPGSGSGSGDGDHVITSPDERPTETGKENGISNETGDRNTNSAPLHSLSSILLLSLTTIYYYFWLH
ncbi:hypothetical protein LOTGIDRAFT_160154 [Lottia gigantea]|uniref:Uncharacterized protein n=1 Tax=Lottia gigantea TaxID=225164 RepID=V4AN10_LOTGI|nr:hypothetical protein LOTGIDRAFT_160154 [Lottia gigantea]ESO96165.1 hypothetical protein LOTGIDRAFT_160154 [Lottia gigantea]